MYILQCEEFGSSLSPQTGPHSPPQTGSHSPPNLKVSVEMDNPLELFGNQGRCTSEISACTEHHDFVYVPGDLVPNSETSSSSGPVVPVTSSSSGPPEPEALSIHSMNNQQRPFTEILRPLLSLALLCKVGACGG